MNDFVISASGVEKSYESFQLGPLELNIEPGVVVAFVGPNGSGKTTLFHMLMDIIKPDRGEIQLLGNALGQDDVLVKRRIGYVPDLSYIEEASGRVEEVAQFHSHWYPSWSAEKWTDLSRKFELNPMTKVRTLSKGMKRRLAFSLAVAQMPELLILDEPSAGMDPFIWRTMLDEIREFANTGERTVLIATHTVEEVRRLADYVAFLYKGRLLHYQEKDTMLDKWRMFWVEQQTASGLPGEVEREEGVLTRIVTRDAAVTERALEEAGIAIVRRQAVELDEILHYMMRASVKQTVEAGTKRGD
ncbi:ABC transporter ATP-binding protein [Paenibacillus hodogayensis]